MNFWSVQIPNDAVKPEKIYCIFNGPKRMQEKIICGNLKDILKKKVLEWTEYFFFAQEWTEHEYA